MKSDEEKTTPITKMEESSRDDSFASYVGSKPYNGSGVSPSPSPSTKNMNTVNSDINKAKTCKGYLYYSTHLKVDSRNHVCVGLARSLPKLLQLYVGQSEMEASKEGRTLADFRYGYIGYSLYTDQKGEKFNGQETQTELPMCVGFEMLVDRRVNTVDSVSGPGTHIHNREDGNGWPNHQSPRPTKLTGEEFFSRCMWCDSSVRSWRKALELRQVHTSCPFMERVMYFRSQ